MDDPVDDALGDPEPDSRLVLDSIPALVIVMTPAGEVEHVNRQVLEYFGGTLGRAADGETDRTVPPDEPPTAIEILARSIATRQLEHRLRRHDGEYRWFQARGVPASPAERPAARWYVLLTDIEDRKRAEDRLRASEGNLRKIIDTLPVTAWSTLPDGYCDFLNRRWLDYAGFSAEQAEGWGWSSVIHPDDAPHLAEHWHSRLASGAPVDVEARMRRSDGVYRWFLFRANPLRDEAGKIVKWYGTNVDIEDRKLADEALRSSELNLRELTETIPEMLWSATATGVIDYCNRRFLDYTGVTVKAMSGGWGVSLHPEDVERASQAWAASVATGAPYQIEVRTFHVADRTYRWCAMSALPLVDDRGRILKWHGTAVDVHDRTLAQEELRRSEQDARLIVDCIPGQVAVLGPTGDVRQVNRRMAEFFGKSAEGLSDWRTSDIVPPYERARVVAAMARLLETGEAFEMENRLRRFDGVYAWFQVRGLPLMDSNGSLLRWYFLIVDIEQRMQAEEALRRSEAFLAEAQRISSTGSFSWRLDTDEIVSSRELRRIFELDEDAPITHEQVTMRTHPDDVTTLSRSIEEVRGSTGEDFEFERRLRMPDGRIKHVRTLGRLIHHSDGRRECVGAVQDMTQRHLSEDALDKTRSELAHVTRSLSLGVLTASIAHEVNQPLTGIVTNAGACLRMLTAEPPNVEGALETVRRTIRDGNRAAEVIARLRALFGKKAVAKEAVDLNDATREVISLLSSDLQRKRVIVRAELDGDSGRVTGDRVQLQQVILNLVRNASDAMSGVDDRPRHLLIKTERDAADQVRLQVQDVGIGLGPAGLDKLFHPFYTTKADSMGIGLSVSRSIIESHGGRLWAVSNDGPGATFFSIPRGSEPTPLNG